MTMKDLIYMLVFQTIIVWLGWNILIAFGVGFIFGVSIPLISLAKAFLLGIIISFLMVPFMNKQR